MFCSPSLNPLTPLSPVPGCQLQFHKPYNFLFGQPELKVNGVKRCTVFPCHLDDPVDFLWSDVLHMENITKLSTLSLKNVLQKSLSVLFYTASINIEFHEGKIIGATWVYRLFIFFRYLVPAVIIFAFNIIPG